MAADHEQRQRAAARQPVTVSRLIVTLRTADDLDAGTAGEVYLILGGREFRLRLPGIANLPPATSTRYRLGDPNANIENPARNNPTGLNVARVLSDPIGLRFAPTTPDDTWQLADATLWLHTSDGDDLFELDATQQEMWLGIESTLAAAFRFRVHSAPRLAADDPT